MKPTKAAIVTALVATAALIVGIVSYNVFNLAEVIPAASNASTLIGGTAGEFGMKLALVATLGTIIGVPSIRSAFSGSYQAGNDYQRNHKKSGKRKI